MGCQVLSGTKADSKQLGAKAQIKYLLQEGRRGQCAESKWEAQDCSCLVRPGSNRLLSTCWLSGAPCVLAP